jgi:hypothetical protein
MSARLQVIKNLARLAVKHARFAVIGALLLPTLLTAQKALILDSTTVGGANSNEALAAVAAGFTVTDVSDATWESMTTSQFAAYQLIILADPSCVVGTGPITAALSNTSTWGAAVNGNVVVIGTDPTYHKDSGTAGAGQLMTSAVKFAGAQAGKTGLYAALSCYYAYSPDKTVMPLLDGITPDGSFTLIGLNGAGLCFNNAHIVATSPSLSGLGDADLSNWSCSVHEAFDAWPPSFEVLAMAENFGSSYTATDGTIGSPYILSRGATVISNIVLTPATSTDVKGGSQLLTAKVTTSSSAPVIGTTVTFTVISGPDTGKTGTGVTNGSGVTTFNLTNSPAATGTDYINASFINASSLKETSGNVSVTWTAGTADTTPPTCSLTGTVAGPPKQILITVQDTGSGLSSIVSTEALNATMLIPNFTVGTTKAQVVTATKTNQAATSDVALKVTDVAGNVTSCDPVDMTLKDDGVRGEHTFTKIPASEHFLELSTGRPMTGAAAIPSMGHLSLSERMPEKTIETRVEVRVNGKLIQTLVPGFNTKLINLGPEMVKGSNNTIEIWAYGPRGGTVYALIHD